LKSSSVQKLINQKDFFFSEGLQNAERFVVVVDRFRGRVSDV